MQGFLVEQMDEGYGAAVDGFVEFLVDKVISKIDVTGVLLRVAIIHTAQVSPIDGAEAHGAGLARSVDDAVGEVEGAQFSAGLADGIDFSVGSRIVVEGDAVGAAGDDLTVFDDDGSKRAAAVPHALVGQADGFSHKGFIFRCNSHHCRKIQANIMFFFKNDI